MAPVLGTVMNARLAVVLHVRCPELMSLSDLMAPFQLETNTRCIVGIVGSHRLVIRALRCRENTDLVCESLQVLAFPGVSFRYISHATLIEFECRPTALLADLTVGLRHHPSEVLWGVVVVLRIYP